MGAWYPEDRLRASLLPLALIVPLPVIAFGSINTFVDGSVGLLLSLLCLFINGIGVSNFICRQNEIKIQILTSFFKR